MKKIFYTAAFILTSLLVSAQYKYRDSNHIGIILGINQTSLSTTNFKVNPEMGWNAGLSMRGNFYNNWDMVYAMQFSENNFSVDTRNILLAKEAVNYKLASVQIALMGSYKIIENHLSFELGPVVQVNDKLKLDQNQNNNIISGTTLRAIDIVEINTFNFHAAVGITAGIKNLRLNIQYQQGINNILANLNENNLKTNFKGNLGILSGNLIIYL